MVVSGPLSVVSRPLPFCRCALYFVLCALPVRCPRFAGQNKNPPPAFVGSGSFENRFCAFPIVSAGTRSPARHHYGGDTNEHRGRDLFQTSLRVYTRRIVTLSNFRVVVSLRGHIRIVDRCALYSHSRRGFSPASKRIPNPETVLTVWNWAERLNLERKPLKRFKKSWG
jgi:hypothetical protein